MKNEVRIKELFSLKEGDSCLIEFEGELQTVKLLEVFKRLDLNEDFDFYHALCADEEGFLDCVTIDEDGEIFLGGNWECDFDLQNLLFIAHENNLQLK
jgi:hypothetical protein